MSNKQQTAVLLLKDYIDKLQIHYLDIAKKDKSKKKEVDAILTATTLIKMQIQQAKELEKQQIIDARQDGSDSTYLGCESCSSTNYHLEGSNEQYYIETYTDK